MGCHINVAEVKILNVAINYDYSEFSVPTVDEVKYIHNITKINFN